MTECPPFNDSNDTPTLDTNYTSLVLRKCLLTSINRFCVTIRPPSSLYYTNERT